MCVHMLQFATTVLEGAAEASCCVRAGSTLPCLRSPAACAHLEGGEVVGNGLELAGGRLQELPLGIRQVRGQALRHIERRQKAQAAKRSRQGRTTAAESESGAAAR